MKIGDLIMTNKIEVRTDPGPCPLMRANFKASNGRAFVFLNFGTVQSNDEVDDRVLKVMDALGWVPCDDIEKLRAALAKAEASEATAAQAATDKSED